MKDESVLKTGAKAGGRPGNIDGAIVLRYGNAFRVLGGPATKPSVCVMHMPKYVIERDLPGAGKLTPDQLQGISEKSCSVLQQLGPQVQWVQSYVTDDKIYCVYIAPNPNVIREHAKRGGFPANRISEVRNVIDPTTSERTPA